MSDIDYTHHYRRFHDGSPGDTAASVADFRRRLALTSLPPDHDTKVLDVGCGAGHCLLALRELGYSELEGMDADPGQVEAASLHGLQVSHVTADQFPGFASSRRDAYGLVTLLDVLEHVERGRQIEFLSRVGSMLAPGGRLICQVPNADSVVASRYRYIDWTHHISFTVESLEFLLHCAGLGTLETLEDNPNLRPSTLVPARAWARWLYRGLMRGLRRLEMGAEIGLPAARVLPLSKNIIAVATRLS